MKTADTILGAMQLSYCLYSAGICPLVLRRRLVVLLVTNRRRNRLHPI